MESVPVARLKAAASPVLVLNGGGDDPDDAAKRFSAMIPGAVAVVAGLADHALAWRDDDFQSALVSFLRQHWQ